MTVSRVDAIRLRREGMADAAVLLLARRVVARFELADWGKELGLDYRDLQEAVARLKERAEGQRRAALTALPGGRPSRARKPAATKYRKAEDGTWLCPYDGCDAVYNDGRGLSTHVRSHERATCTLCDPPREMSAPGLGPHKRSVHGIVAGAAS